MEFNRSDLAELGEFLSGLASLGADHGVLFTEAKITYGDHSLRGNLRHDDGEYWISFED